MASIEVASEMSKYTNYLIASEETEPAYGWNYSFLSEVGENTDTVTLAKSVIDYTYKYYENLSKKHLQSFYTTLSVMDLKKVKSVEENLSKLFKNVDGSLDYDNYSEIVRYLTKSTSFGYNGEDQSYDLIDMKEMSESLEKKYGTLAKNLTDSISDLVLYQKTNISGANGVSIYYPYYTKKYLESFMSVYNNLNFSQDYKNFLKSYTEILMGEKIIKSTKTLSLINDNNNLSATLDDELLKNYNDAEYIIVKHLKEEDSYMIVFESSDVTLDDSNGEISANYNKKYITITKDDEILGAVGLMDLSRQDETIYGIPVELYRGSVYKDDFEIFLAIVQFVVNDDYPEGQMLSIVPLNDLSNIATSKNKIDLDEWDRIKFYTLSDKVFDDNGNMVYGKKAKLIDYNFKVKDNFNLKLVDLDNDGEYYCFFEIEDTQGNKHYTDLVKVN